MGYKWGKVIRYRMRSLGERKEKTEDWRDSSPHRLKKRHRQGGGCQEECAAARREGVAPAVERLSKMRAER